MHNLFNIINWDHQFAPTTNAPNCVEPLGNGFTLTSLRDKFLQSTKFLHTSGLITLRIMKNEMFIVGRGEFFVDLCGASLALLKDVERWDDNCNRRYTAREALKTALISDDFPALDY